MKRVITKTKIVCTIGPVSEDPSVFKKLVEAGMDVCRLNFSHGSYSDHRARFELIKDISDDLAVLVDLCGPKIRTGEVKEGTVIKTGKRFRISADINVEGNSKVCTTNYPPLIEDAQVGNHLAIDDGILLLKVTKKTESELVCKVLNGGPLKSRKGINAPDVPLSLYFPLEKDLQDIRYVIRKLDVDFFAASFVRRKEDILKIREILDNVHSPINIISKIEHRDAIDNFDEILEVSDGIMVARGDLGIEIPTEQVPIVQKDLISKCNHVGKPVIVATQMLESMINNPRPTRAEASDVSNAILDGADAVMLSGETAVGKFPVEAVEYMEKIAKAAEDHGLMRPIGYGIERPTITEVFGRGVYIISKENHLNIKAILTNTRRGSTARLVAKYRPKTPIISGTPYPSTKRQLNLVWGVCPIQTEVTNSSNELKYLLAKKANEMGLLDPEDQVLIIGGSLLGFPAATNLIQTMKVDDILLFGQQLRQPLI
ncbi:MAG: pyruvate kinase [Candidatus Heimdallarchaeota archaeon]|nr:MAG: pyruvate kinase [Candidatus Heimdallarchaeota archaeon]